MTAKALPTKVMPRVPPGYEDAFIRYGHRGPERLYGFRSDVHVKIREALGGIEVLQEKRQAWLKGVRRGDL